MQLRFLIVTFVCGVPATLSVAQPGGQTGVPWFNVMNYGAAPLKTTWDCDAQGVTDSAPAFRAALAAAQNSKGGVVYIPSGVYFLTSTDGSHPNSHIAITDASITFLGEGARLHLFEVPPDPIPTGAWSWSDAIYKPPVNSPWIRGTTLISTTPDKNVFGLHATAGPNPRDIAIRDIHISRCKYDTGQLGGLAAGIAFVDNDPADSADSIERVQLDGVVIDRHRYGILLNRAAELQNSPIAGHFIARNCEIRNNYADGIRLDDFIEMRLSDSWIYYNGRDGLNLRSGRDDLGLALVTNTTVFGNGRYGIYLEGRLPAGWPDPTAPELESKPLLNIHISNGEVDGNQKGGLVCKDVLNLTVSNMAIVTNGGGRTSVGGPQGQGPGAVLERCISVSFVGCEVRRNAGNGLDLVECHGVAISGSNFDSNNFWGNLHTAQLYSLAFRGGRHIAVTGCAFAKTNSGPNVALGMQLTQDANMVWPKNVVAVGLTFQGTGTFLKKIDWTPGMGNSGRIEYFDPDLNSYIAQNLN